MTHRAFAVALLSGAIIIVISATAWAQTGSATAIAAPDYGSGASAGALSNSHFNTPESDGRPGVKFFTYGVQAFRKGDYRHAVDMYKVAASWAYKPAQYNLGVMYFKGQGVPVDRPLGAAWMVLAAERGDPRFVRTRDMMVTLLGKAEFARTDELWGQLKQTYGDKVALRRAKAQWAWVRTHQTGTRVGGAVGWLHVGVDEKPDFHGAKPTGGDTFRRAGWGYLPGGSTDGSVAYRQFQQSDNPYDPIFLNSRNGTATVGPLTPLKSDNGKKQDKQRTESQPPGHPPRSA
jgi:hypothetical protein